MFTAQSLTPKILSLLADNRAHFHEIGLGALILKHNGKNFHASGKFPQDKKFNAFIITVDTPLMTGTHEPNFGYIRQGEIVHIGNSGQEVKIIDLLRLCLKIAEYNPEIKIMPAPEGCVARRCPDTEKLYRLTDFRTGITLEQALPEMYKWYDKAYTEREKS